MSKSRLKAELCLCVIVVSGYLTSAQKFQFTI